MLNTNYSLLLYLCNIEHTKDTEIKDKVHIPSANPDHVSNVWYLKL